MTRALLLLLVFAVPGCQIANVRAPNAYARLAATSSPQPLVSSRPPLGGNSEWGARSRTSELAPTCMQMGLGVDGPAALVLGGVLLLALPFWILERLVSAPLEILRRR